eukprot:COSAG05_NODE_6044_length_1034_cov_16.042781_1_plen_27_part_10
MHAAKSWMHMQDSTAVPYTPAINEAGG